MTRHETPLADAWLHATGCGEPLNGLLDGRYEVDAYLLLDQEGPPCPADVDGVQLQMQGNCSGGLSSCPNDEPFSTLQSGSPYGQGDEQGSRRHGSTVASKGGSRSRKCTSLAQREAHKRYREKKKMNIAQMEQDVAAKRDQLEALQAENARLKSKTRVLETAERCSVEIHELMQLLNGLQALVQEEEMATGSDKGRSTCTSGLPAGSGSGSGMCAPAAACAGAGDGSGPGSCSGLSSQGSLREGSGSMSAAAASGARDQQGGGDGSFLQALMAPSQSQTLALGAAPAAGTAAAPQGAHEGPSSHATLLSLQNEQYWLQMAQRYVDAPQPQESQGHQGPVPAAAAGDSSAAGPAPSTTAAAAAAAATTTTAAGTSTAAADGPATPHSGCVSGVSPSSTAESGSSVLVDLGSVDTAEQGLVMYKGFLQKASELLALAQQQQQQGEAGAAAAIEEQLDDLTRTTFGRLQPFLVERGQGVVYDWNARNLETQQPQEPPASLWRDVLNALQLSEDHQRDALQCFDLFGAPLTRLLEERAMLAHRYRELQSAATGGLSSSGGGAAGEPGAPWSSALTLEAIAEHRYSCLAVLKALAAKLERYQSLDGVFAHSLTSLLTGAQLAAACVASYPYLPRWHSLMAALKQQKAEEDRLLAEARGNKPQRRSGRVRTATQAVKEAYV